MKDLIKEFSTLDLLGMIFPGSVLMVLICAECGAWPMIEQFVGSGMIGGVKTVVILFGGYALGMLLHDIGDMAERLLWQIPVFNPKVAVLLYNRDASIFQFPPVQPEDDGAYQGLSDRFQLIVGVSPPYALMSSLWLAFLFYIEWNLRVSIESFFLTLGSVTAIIIILTLAGKLFWEEKYKDTDLLPYKEITGKSEQAFSQKQTEYKFRTTGKADGSASKVNLFDGFRAMARNLLVGVFIAYIWAHFSTGIFYQLFFSVFSSMFAAVCFYFVLLLLMIRYWRYAFLQYKYIYEDIAYMNAQKKEKPEQNTAESKKGSVSVVQFLFPSRGHESSGHKEKKK